MSTAPGQDDAPVVIEVSGTVYLSTAFVDQILAMHRERMFTLTEKAVRDAMHIGQLYAASPTGCMQ